jgi:dihydrofolate synthase / folylpolyglutamate synthase
MSYSGAVEYLYGLQKHGIKLGLENTTQLLALLGNPERRFRSIHVAGTNGKGSVSAISASLLRAHGFRVGLFTSPHLASFTERINVEGIDITEAEVVELTDEISAVVRSDGSLNPTFFEFVTVMALCYFASKGVEWAVVETGMGGRLDATNTVTPQVSVITAIGSDHREFLGEGIADIAAEKAGIIKSGVPVITAQQKAEAAAVISLKACEKSAALYRYGEGFWGVCRGLSLNGCRFDYNDKALPGGGIQDLFEPLAGNYQIANASLAIRAVSVAVGDGEKDRPEEKERIIRAGLASVKLRGRLEFSRTEPPVIIDVAHNTEAAVALAGFLKECLGDRRVISVIGMMADKDISGFLGALRPVISEAIFTAPAYIRAESPDRIAVMASEVGYTFVSVASTVEEAVKLALDRQAIQGDDRPPVVLITGSFYTAGEAVGALGERAPLNKLRETL